MSPPRRQPPEYRRRTFLDAWERGPRSPHTLEAGVAAVFPDANPRRLSDWVKAVRARSAAEAEPLLFLALLCGTRLSIERESVATVLEDV